MSKKVSYKNLLKQAISEYDTSKTVQVKGPMLDPILSWDGDGEIPVYKDAASILERYYFNESQEDPVTVSDFDEDDLQEMEYNQDGTEKKTPSEKHGEGAGTEQAGTESTGSIKGDLKEKEKDIAKEQEEVAADEAEEAVSEAEEELSEEDQALIDTIETFFSEQDEAEEGGEEEEEKEEKKEPLDVDKKMGEKEGEEAAEEDEEEEEVKESEDITEDAENAVIEKLIDEMEDLEEGDEVLDEKEMTYSDDDVAPGMSAPKEKKAKDPEEDTKGAGTQQAGTGPAEGQIPPRKDQHDDMVKAKNYSESEELSEDELLEALLDEEEEHLEEKEWDDKDVPKKKKYYEEAAPNALGRVARGGADKDHEEPYNEDYMKESFELFKEAIEEDNEDDDEIIV